MPSQRATFEFGGCHNMAPKYRAPQGENNFFAFSLFFKSNSLIWWVLNSTIMSFFDSCGLPRYSALYAINIRRIPLKVTTLAKVRVYGGETSLCSTNYIPLDLLCRLSNEESNCI